MVTAALFDRFVVVVVVVCPGFFVVVVVEDAAYCAETAHNAGFYVVGIYDENTAPRGNVADFCDCFITRLADFPEL